MNNHHRHISATEGGNDDDEEDTIVSMEVIRGDWSKVRTARENQLQSLTNDQLKNIASFCSSEQFRSQSGSALPGSNNYYKEIIMDVLECALLASIDVEKTKKKRLKSLDHFKKCLEYIDHVRKNRHTATASTANTVSSTRRDSYRTEAATVFTSTATINPPEGHHNMNDRDVFPCIALENCITPLELARNIPPQPHSERVFNSSTASDSNPTVIQTKDKSSNPKNTGPATNIPSATTATTPSINGAFSTSNSNLLSQTQSSISLSTTTTSVKPHSGAGGTTDRNPSTYQPVSFMSMLQKAAITRSTAVNPSMASTNSLISDSSTSATAAITTPTSIVAASTTGANHLIPNTLPANTNDCTSMNVTSHTNDNSIDRTANSGISASKNVQSLQSSDLSVHALVTDKTQTTAASSPSFPSATISIEPSENFTSDNAVNGTCNDPRNEKRNDKYPGDENSTSLVNSDNNKLNNDYSQDQPVLSPPFFDSDKHISFLYQTLPGERTRNLCTFDIGAAVEPYAASLYTRRACRILYPAPTFPSINMMHNNGTINIRFNRWDPFYKCQHDIVNFVRDKTTNQIINVQYRDSMGVEQFPVAVTSSIVNCIPLDARGRQTTGAIDPNVKPMVCIGVNFQFPTDIANLVKSWGFESLGKENDANRLICRMLPLDNKAMKTDFADTHLWPKGTYMEVNGKPVVLQQRRQQSHDPTQWKGMCKLLDLTPYITIPISMNRIKLVAQENACYALQICIAELRSPLTVFNEVLRSIPVIPMADALERGKQYVNNQTVCLEHDNMAVSRARHKQEMESSPGKDDKGETTADSNHLTFKLVCPISMTVMNEPVRGQQCQHFQCFDLFNFIETNSFPSGRRWKCPCCDSFVSLDSLELCGWFKEILKIHESKVSADGIDSVKMFPNGQWELFSSSSNNNNKRKADVLPQQQTKRNKGALEVIEIDLD